MKTSFANLWRRSNALARLAIASALEYRLNFFIDVFAQPLVATTVELTLWVAIFAKTGMTSLNGFAPEYYLAYALWATTVGRVAANWMYEYMMTDDVDQGRINAILVRPISFYEYYLFQFIGYKLGTAGFTFWIPAALSVWWGLPCELSRIPLMILLVIYYLVFIHTLAFLISSLAFFMNRVHSMTGIKNMALWILGGEIFPLDLMPEPLHSILVHLPFASAVYIPVGYVTGRLPTSAVGTAFVSLTVGIAVVGIFALMIYRRGLRVYSGTGA